MFSTVSLTSRLFQTGCKFLVPSSTSTSTSSFSSTLKLFNVVPASTLTSTRSLASSSHPAWRLGRLNHVAVATNDLPKSMALYRDVMGAKVSDPEDLPEHGVTVVFVELDNTKIELLKPLGEKSPISAFLAKNASGGIHHVCIEVDDIEQAVQTMKDSDIRCLSEKTRIGAHGKPVMFLHPKDCAGVLVELEQA